jgi:WD40 repeat protein
MLPPDFTIHNRYRVNAIIDERPGSWLYRARDDQSGSFVLIAALPAEGDEAREDLALVAGQIATVRNDLLLPLTEHFAEGDRYYLVCGDPGGQDLDRTLRIRGGPLPEPTVLPQFVWLLGALEYLHGQRPPLYLGDPTPNDLWIGEDGTWRIAPFALARPIGHMPSPYRAPELAEPHADMTAASDLYAIGALLYHTLTGMPPTSAEQQAAGAPLIGPRALNPTISLLGEQALLRALQLRPVNRYQAAREMRTALETIHMMGGRSLGLGPDVLGASPAAAQPVPATPAPPSVQPTPPGPYPVPAPAPAGIYPAPTPAAPPPASAPPPQAYPPAMQPQAYPAPPARRGISTGCLVALVITLTLLALSVCVVAAMVLWPGGPLNWLISGNRQAPPLTTAPSVSTAAPAAAPAAATSAPAAAICAPIAQAAPAGAPPPTAAPADLGQRTITLSDGTQITQTRVITSPIFGPVAFSPDGKSLAIGVSDVIKLNNGTSLDEERELVGHTGQVGALAWTPDGAILASGAINDNTIRLWNPATGRLIRTLTGHTGWIRSLAVSPDGKLLASGSTDRTIRLWDIATGRSLHTLEGHTGLLGGVSFSPDGQSLASGSRDGTVRLWDVASGQQCSGFKFEAPLSQDGVTRYWMTGVAFSPDGKALAAGATDGIVRLLNPATGEEQRQLRGHTDWVVIRGVVFSPDGKILATASIDGSIRLWDPATGEEIATLDGHQLQILSITFSPDGKQLISSSDEEGRILVWDVASKAATNSLRIGQGLIAALAFSPNGQTLGVSGFNGIIRLYSTDESEQARSLNGSTVAAQQSLAFLDDGRVVAITQSDRVTMFDGTANPGEPLAGLDGKPVSVATSPNGALIAAGNDQGKIAIWDGTNGAARRELQGELKVITRLAFNDDGSLLAAGGPSDDPRVEVWDTATGQKRRTLVGSQGLITGLAFQPGSPIVAVADVQGALRLWDAQDGQLAHTISAQQAQQRFVGLAFSPDGKALATGALNGDIQLWNPADGKMSIQLNLGTGSALALAFSPDGRQLAVGGRDETVRVLELPKG